MAVAPVPGSDAPTSPPQSREPGTAALCLAIVVAYAVAGAVGLRLADVCGGVSIFWPPTGVGLAAVVRYGRRSLPGITLGALLVNIASYGTNWDDLALTAGNVGGAVLGGWLATRHGRLSLDSLSGVGVLVFAAVLGSVPSTLVGSSVLWFNNHMPGGVLVGGVVWWTGDMAGVLLVAPLLLRPALVAQQGDRSGIAWAGLVASTLFAVTFAATPKVPHAASLAACLPVMAVAAVRYGPRGAAIANVVPAVVVVALAVQPQAMDLRIALAGFLAVSAVTALCLGATTAERDTAEAALTADISARVAAERRRAIAEEALAADRARFATLLAHSHDAIAVLTKDARTAFVSDAITHVTGRRPADLVGRGTFENIHPDDLTLVRLTFADTLAHPGLPTKMEFRLRRADGRWIWLETIAANHLDNPAVAGVVVNIRDVTERREVENRLGEARSLLEATGRLARIGGWEYIIAEDRLTWSEQTYHIHEVSPVDFTPTLAAAIEFYAPEGRGEVRSARERALSLGEPWNLTVPFVTARGRRLWVNVIGQIETRGGEPYRLYGTLQDVTERVEAERAVERSEARYRNLFDAAPVAIWEEDMTAVDDWFKTLRAAGVTDLGAYLAAHPHLAAEALGMIRVRNVNRAAVHMNRATNKTELLSNLSRLFNPETHAAFVSELVALWNGERDLQLTTRANRLDGEPTDIVLHVGVPEAAGRPDFSRVVVLAVDVTEQKRLEEQFRQSQKLEAVARLAGGLAHDFNNLLTVINGFSELIAAEVPPGTPVRALVTHIQNAGARGAELTRQLLAFSRKQPPAAGPVSLPAVIEGIRPLLTPLIGEEVVLVTQLAPVPPVVADRGQLESIVMNLCVNARDAMPSGGTLSVETDVVGVRDLPSADEPPPGTWVVLSVSDTGTGIPEEVRPHLFEPFFTTKELGKGTGLGLSTVYGIVTTAGGHIRFTTAIGRGTTFRIYLPTDRRQAETAPPGTAPQLPPASAGPVTWGVASTSGNPDPLLLLVDDQDAIRDLSARVLRETGFEVVTAASGPEAVGKLPELTRPLAMLVTDVRMPRMGGREVAARVRSAYPGVKVLYVSGDTEEVSSPDEAFLPKPFTIDELTDAVIALLGPKTHPDA